MAWDTSADLWWMKPRPDADHSQEFGQSFRQAFALAYNARQQMMERQLQERQLQLAEKAQNLNMLAKQKELDDEIYDTDLLSSNLFIMEGKTAREKAEMPTPPFRTAKAAEAWNTALTTNLSNDLEWQSRKGLLATLSKYDPDLYLKATSALKQSGGETTPEVEKILNSVAVEQDKRNLAKTESLIASRERIAGWTIQSRERMKASELAAKYGEEGSSEPIGTRRIVPSEWSDEPAFVLTKVAEGKYPWHVQHWGDLSPQDQALFKNKLSIGRDRLNLIDKELAPIKAAKSTLKEGSSEWVNAQKEIDRLERERIKIEYTMYKHRTSSVPVPAPTTPPAAQPFTVPPRTGVVAPTNVNEIVAPPIGVPANATGIELSEELAAEYLKKAGGDVQKARKMARDDGYFF